MKQYSSSRCWIDETIPWSLEAGVIKKNLCCVAKTLKLDEISPKIDINDPYIWWKTFFVEMEVGLMEIVRPVNRSWIYDT